MPESTEPKKWWQGAPAVIAGVAALVTAIGAVLQALSSSGVTGLFSGPKPPEWEQVIDREYIAITSARVWSSQDITQKPVAELRQAGSFIVRGKIKGTDLYLVEYAPGQIGYVVTQHLVESAEWRRRREREQQEQHKQREIEIQTVDATAIVRVEPSTSIKDWVPFGARLSPPWDFSASVLQAPKEGAKQVGVLPPGKQLPRAVIAAGAVELLQKISGGEWYLIGSLNKPLGYVRGDEVTEIWPRHQPPQTPIGKFIRAWETQDKIEYPCTMWRHISTYLSKLYVQTKSAIGSQFIREALKIRSWILEYFNLRTLTGFGRRESR